MHITWYGQSCFKLQSKDTVVIIDPYQKEVGLPPLRTKADLVLSTHDHPSHNNIDAIKGDPFVIDIPGEFEKKGVYIKGIRSYHDDKEGKELGENTIYIIEIEKINICHLGDLGHTLSSKQVERIDAVDILLVNVGETNALPINKISDVISDIDPRIVIPMHYSLPNVKNKLTKVDSFLSEMGEDKIKPEPKLLIKAKDLPQEDTKIILLENAR